MSSDVAGNECGILLYSHKKQLVMLTVQHCSTACCDVSFFFCLSSAINSTLLCILSRLTKTAGANLGSMNSGLAIAIL